MKRDLFKSTVVISYAQFISVLSSLVQFMILARVFSKEDYGSFSQMFTVVTLSLAIFSLSLPNSIQYFLAKTDDKKEQIKLISQIVTLCVIFLGLCNIAMIFSFPLITQYLNNPSLNELLIPILIIVGSQIISANFEYIFVTLNRSALVVWQKSFYAIVKLLLAIVTFYFHLPLVLFAYGLGVMEIVFCGYVLYAIRTEVGRLVMVFDRVLVGRILFFCIPLAFSFIVGTINIEFGKLYLSRNFELESIGEYSVLSRELPINIIAIALTSVLIPHMSRAIERKETNKLIDIWKKSVEVSYMAVVWIIGILIMMAPEVVKFLYSEKYLMGIDIFRIFAFVMLMRVTYFGMILRASGNTKKLLYCAVGMLGLNVILTYILSPILQMKGVALAVLVSTIVMNFMQLYLSTKILGCTLREIFPWGRLAKMTGVNVIIGIAMCFLGNLFNQLGFHFVLSLIVVSIVWMFIYWSIYYKRFLYLRREMMVVD